MFRVLIASACVTIVLFVAIIVANAVSEEPVKKKAVSPVTSAYKGDDSVESKNAETNASESSIKDELIKKIQVDIVMAETDLQKKLDRLKQIEKLVETTKNLSVETQKQFDVLIGIMTALQDSIAKTSEAADKTFWQAQLQMVKYEDAKRKYSRLSSELENGKHDYELMKEAANKAAASAKVALNNISV